MNINILDYKSLLKKYPWLIYVVGGFGAFIIYEMFFNVANSSTSTATSSSAQDIPPNQTQVDLATIAAQTQLGTAQVTANAQTQIAQYQLQATESTNEVQKYGYNMQYLLGMNTNQTNLGIAGIQSQTQINTNQSNVQIAGINEQGLEAYANAEKYAAKMGGITSIFSTIAGLATKLPIFQQGLSNLPSLPNQSSISGLNFGGFSLSPDLSNLK